MATNPQQNQNTENPAETPGEGDEFGAAMNEAADLEDNVPAREAATDDKDGDEGEGSADSSAPADEAAASEQATDGDDNDASQAGTSDSDIWANAPPELREAHEKAVRDADLRYRSSQGRVSALDRELARLRESQPGRQQQQGQGRSEEAGQDADTDKGAPSEKESRLAALREEYPDVAEPILDEIAELRTELAKVSKTTGAFEQERNQAELTRQESYLTTQHPDWQEAAQDDRFAGWLDQQPTSLKQAFQRNFHGIVDGADAALVIGKFKADVGFNAPGSGEHKDTPGQQSDQQTQRRAKQLQGGRDGGGGKTGPVTSGVPDEFESASNYWADRV